MTKWRKNAASLMAGLAILASFLSPASATNVGAPSRIISLAPNMTELLFALGLGDRVVGVTTFCDYPEEAKKKPKVGGMSNPSLEAVVSLKPDIVVMTTDGNPKEFEDRLRSMGIRTYVSRQRRISELPEAVRGLGQALGIRDRADRLAAAIRADLFRHKRTMAAGKGRRVLFIVWPEPLIVAGAETVIDDAISLVGGLNMAARAGGSYPKYSIEEILRNPPDFIVIGKGMDRDDVKRASEGLLKRLRSVPAVREGRVFFAGDELYRLGPRTPKGVEELAAVLRRRP